MIAKDSPIIDLAEWLEQPAGTYIRQWEQAQFDELTVDIFGYHALQIGLPKINALAMNRMPHRWQSDDVTPLRLAKKKHGIALIHDFAELPFDSQSLDLVVLPHVLEFAAEPHQVLREVERVLIPEGRVIICGLNRTSLWGMRQILGRNFLPKEGEFISAARLKDWLKLLSMEIQQMRFGCYAPPFKTEQWLQRYKFMESIGQRWWPYLGAVYMIEATKRVRGMHLVGPALSRKQVKQARAVPVTNRDAHIK